MIGPMLGPLFVRVEDVVKTDEAPSTTDEQFYTVMAGDTLPDIALHFYKNGDFEHFNAIYKVNKHILKTQEDLLPGQKLIIPKL